MIHTALASGVLFVTLNRPANRNALNEAMLAALDAELARTEADRGVCALVLRGAGGNFCAGGDFTQFKALMSRPVEPDAPDPISRHNRAFGALLTRLASAPVPTIAWVAGAAFGGGVGLAAACDFVLAMADAQFAMPETTLGLPPAQIAPFVAARVGRPAALRLMCAGTRLDGRGALHVGLVDTILGEAQPDAALLEVLNRLGRAEPDAVRATKRILAHPGPLPAQLDFAAECFAQALRRTAAEGMAAFAGKRTPAWQWSLAALPEMPR